MIYGASLAKQLEHEREQRKKWQEEQMLDKRIKQEAIRQAELATGKIHANVDGEDRYFTPEDYETLFGKRAVDE